MGTEKQGSKHGKNIGGFLQLFDWNAKSRKKLFSSKSDFPDKLKQKKRCDGNLPMTRLHMLDEDEYIVAGSSFKGSSDYSCASSVTDEEFHVTKAPGVVARLMGLDSLPRSNSCEPNSTPLFDCRSLPGSYYKSENLEYRRDSQIMRPNSLQDAPFRTDAEPEYEKAVQRPLEKFQAQRPPEKFQVQRPLEKFQTEILPPKSAKAIPVTRNRLLSPIKSGNAILPENAAHIMEAAARIIEPGPIVRTKAKLPLAGSSSVPFKVRDFKEKVQATQKPSKTSEGSSKSGESSAVKQLRGHCMNKSVNSPGDATTLRIFQGSEESSSGLKGNRKSISLALQAKANVQKREGLNLNGSRTTVSVKESSEVSPNQPVKSQSVAQKNVPKKPSAHNSSVVLRQNNQKQNSTVDVEKLNSKSRLQGGKVLGVDSSTRQRNSSKPVSSSKVSSRKLGSEVKDDKWQLLPSSSERATSKKRSIDGNFHTEKSHAADSIQKDKNGRVIRSRDNSIDLPSSCWVQESERAGADVISFTFTAPITRSGPGSGRYNETEENCKIRSVDSRNKRILQDSNGINNAEFPALGNRVEGKDTLSTLLEQKLKELALKVEESKQKSENSSHGMLPGLDVLMSSTLQEESKTKGGSHADSLQGQQGSSLYSTDSRGFVAGQKCQFLLNELSMHGRNVFEGKQFLDCQYPGPVSVLEHSPLASSCGSSDTADSKNTSGSNQWPLMQIQDVLSEYSSNKLTPFERDAELSESSDSASSTFAGTGAERKETSLTLWNGKPSWEIEYVMEILCNIEPMYKNFVSGRASAIMSPHLFDQLESRKGHLNGCALVDKVNRKLMFDCVSECMELRCRQYAGGGYELWATGMRIVKRKERLAEDVYKEICVWSDMGDFMVDELVDRDMSSRYGRWLDFEVEAFEVGVQIESRILNSLIDEVIANFLVL